MYCPLQVRYFGILFVYYFIVCMNDDYKTLQNQLTFKAMCDYENDFILELIISILFMYQYYADYM